MIKVLVSGAKGKMGIESIKAIQNTEGLTLVGATDKEDKLAVEIANKQPDVVLDFTHPNCVKENIITIINGGAFAVIGTTGLNEHDLKDLHQLAKSKNSGVLICPNFAIGAVLMMEFAAKAAKHMKRCEIIEFHHDKKADAPSGTAINTAELIHESNPEINSGNLQEKELIPGCRGGKKHNIPIHSVRLSGFVANQEVIFGGLAQTLSIRHDTISRESFMPGVVLAIKKVKELKGVVYGLEKVL